MHSSIPKEDRKTAEVLKVRSSTKYLELYEALFKKFSAATSRGHIVNFSWLWSKPESSNWTLIQKSKSNIMLLRFSQKKELRMRSKQRNKRKHKKKNRTITEETARDVQRKVHSNRIGRP